jgi:hypothetical protein
MPNVMPKHSLTNRYEPVRPDRVGPRFIPGTDEYRRVVRRRSYLQRCRRPRSAVKQPAAAE